MDFRNYIPPDGGHVGFGIRQRLAPQNDNYLTLSGPAFSVFRQARGGLRGPDAKDQG